ncbi:MAG: N-acetyltransferase [Clostridiales bacterium]|nr:N-acetyltransferase [Clostridiales bacterium]
MSDILIRNAATGDMPELLRIYEAARGIMRKSGNPHQWADGQPREEELSAHIAKGNLYVCEDGGKPFAAFACIPGEDPTYRKIYEGRWLREAPYRAVHRIGSDGTHGGTLKMIMDHCAGFREDLRVDTHRDNGIMQHLLVKLGFTYCGIIYLENGDERLAYQRCTD